MRTRLLLSFVLTLLIFVAGCKNQDSGYYTPEVMTALQKSADKSPADADYTSGDRSLFSDTDTVLSFSITNEKGEKVVIGARVRQLFSSSSKCSITANGQYIGGETW